MNRKMHKKCVSPSKELTALPIPAAALREKELRPTSRRIAVNRREMSCPSS